MRRASRSPIWIGGVLLLTLLFFAWSTHGLERAIGELQSLAQVASAVARMGERRADALSHDAVSLGRARLETQLHAAVHPAMVGSCLLVISITLLLVLYQRDLARGQQAERTVRESEDRNGRLIEHSTEHRAAEKADQESHRLFLAVIEGTLDAIFVKDRACRYLMVNSACTRFLKKRREEIIGKSDLELYPLETARQFVEQDRRVLASGKTQIFEGVAGGPGDTQAYLVTKSVYRDDDGRIVGLIGISHDITERKRAEEQRVQFIRKQQARREAEAANRPKDEFLATVSHELRTPLTAILGWATILSSRKFDTSAAKRALETIVRNARAQARLIDDILDTSRSVTGKLSRELRSIELVPVIESAIQAVRPAPDTKQIHLDCSLDADDFTEAELMEIEERVKLLAKNEAKE